MQSFDSALYRKIVFRGPCLCYSGYFPQQNSARRHFLKKKLQPFLQHSQNVLQHSESEQRSDKLHRTRSISAPLVPLELSFLALIFQDSLAKQSMTPSRWCYLIGWASAHGTTRNPPS